MHAKGQIAIGADADFREHRRLALCRRGRAHDRAGQHDAIIARVGGRAYYSGQGGIFDRGRRRIGRGFLVR